MSDRLPEDPGGPPPFDPTSHSYNGSIETSDRRASNDNHATDQTDEMADERHVIRHEAADISPSVRESIEQLAANASVYVSGDRLVQVTRATSSDAERSTWKDSQGRERRDLHAGSPRVTAVSPAVLKLRLSEVVRFEKYVRTRNAYEPCAPPDDVVGAVHELRDWDLPHLVGIAETPILRPDGTIACARGYDAQTGYWIAPSERFAAIASEPTKDDAVKAYGALAEVFADFPFASSNQSAVPIATILTVLARAYLARGSVPGVVCDAGAGGVGKTLLTDAMATIATGRPASRKAYPATDEECEKVLAAYALRGASFISIDDVKRPLGGENLDRVLTARGEVDFRRLGKTDLITMPWRAVMAFTGVNVRFVGQMARRVLVARIESRLERPQDRADFKHAELLTWIGENRPRLVVAALTVLRAYLAKGAPDAGCKRWGSFEEWSRLIPHAIVFAGGPDVLAFRPPDDDEAMVEDVSAHRGALAGVERLCVARCPHYNRGASGGLTSGEIVESLKHGGEDHATLRDALRTLGGPKAPPDLTSAVVGVRLAKLKGRAMRVADKCDPTGRVLRLVKIPDTHRGGSDRWAVEDITPGADPNNPRGGHPE
jgi:hypothetical protein